MAAPVRRCPRPSYLAATMEVFTSNQSLWLLTPSHRTHRTSQVLQIVVLATFDEPGPTSTMNPRRRHDRIEGTYPKENAIPWPPENPSLGSKSIDFSPSGRNLIAQWAPTLSPDKVGAHSEPSVLCDCDPKMKSQYFSNPMTGSPAAKKSHFLSDKYLRFYRGAAHFAWRGAA